MVVNKKLLRVNENAGHSGHRTSKCVRDDYTSVMMRQPIQEPARHWKCFAKRGAAGQQGTWLPLSFIRKAKWGTRWVARLCREGSLDVGPLRDPMRAHEVCTQKGASTRTEDVH